MKDVLILMRNKYLFRIWNDGTQVRNTIGLGCDVWMKNSIEDGTDRALGEFEIFWKFTFVQDKNCCV